jgi:hypothetical protein
LDASFSKVVTDYLAIDGLTLKQESLNFSYKSYLFERLHMNFSILFALLIFSVTQPLFSASLPERSGSYLAKRNSEGSAPESKNSDLFYEWPGNSGRVYPASQETAAISTCTCLQIAKPRPVSK